jgi:hypothetical protein
VAHHTEQTGFPAIPLAGGMLLKLEARSPTTDAEVASVTSSRWSIYGFDDSDEPPVDEGPYEPFGVPTSG